MDNIYQSAQKIDGISLFEIIQNRMIDILERWVQNKAINKLLSEFNRKYNFNIVKLKEHLKNRLYFDLYKIVELEQLARSSAVSNDYILLIKRSPFYKIHKDILNSELYFFSLFFSHRLSFVKDNASLSPQTVITYFWDRFRHLKKILDFWVNSSIEGFLNSVYLKIKCKKDIGIKAGIEFYKHRVRFDEINDVFWVKDSNINPKDICSIEFVNYDEESDINFDELGIARYKIRVGFKNWIKAIILGKRSGRKWEFVGANFTYIFKTFFSNLRLIYCLIFWKESGWIFSQLVDYVNKVFYWQAVYKQLGIKILWSMRDVEEDKAAKAEALERVSALYLGSCWSNISMFSYDIQKVYDIFFDWGEHFQKNIFNKYNYLARFKVGYLCDYYFKERQQQAYDLRNKFKDKFILSYMDGVVAVDSYFNPSYQLDMHKMLIRILEKFDNVIVFLKPKRKSTINPVLDMLPELDKYIKTGRIQVFLGDNERVKAVPAEIGMASDLVLGLGISTAASEAFFAGTIAYHADLTGFVNNQFANNGLNEIVFRDISALEKAVENRITGEDKRSYSDFVKYYNILDPFMDGKAYLRVGFIINKLKQGMEAGKTRDEVLELVKSEYESLINKRELTYV